MFSIPKHGWVNISIGDWSDRSSYLTDPHLDTLDALIQFFRNNTPTAIHCDAEGWEYLIVFNWYEIFVIEQKDENKLFSFDINVRDFANEVIKDIEEHLYDWSLWSYSVSEEKDRKDAENEIKSKLDELKLVLSDWDMRHKRVK